MISSVPQRKATDCAIASLASAASVTWEAALEACFPGVDVATLDYYGRDAEAWLAGAKRLGVKVKGTSTYGAPKPQFSHGMMRTIFDGAWAEGTHCVAWYRDASGQVMIYNPSDGGESFPYHTLHVHGLRMLAWYAF